MDFPLAERPALELSDCPKCKNQLFTPLKIKDYWLFKPLGGGGMGSVFKAVSCTQKGDFAVKILPRGKKNDAALRENLFREAEAGYKIGTHPNVVPVVDYGEEDGECFMATEFVDGDRLDNLVEHEHQLSEARALGICRQILDAEIHIASSGYLYRDIKPQNIIICTGDTARLFDYGLCLPIRACASPSQESDILEGSPFYLPPERVVGAAEGEYSEIYSMGMLLFFMLTGRTYYSEVEISDLVNKHLNSLRIASVGNHLKQCRPETVTMLDRMIPRNPNLDEALELAKTRGKSMDFSSSAETSHESKISNRKPLAIGAVILVLAAAAFFTWISGDSGKAEARKAIAAQLGISPDVKAPDMSLDALKKLAAARGSEIFSQRQAEAKKSFDETGERIKLLKELKLSEPLPAPPEKTEAELKKLADTELKRLIDEEKAKRIKPFIEDEAKKRIAESLKVSLPPPAVSKPLENVQKDFEAELKTQVEEKYPVKALAQEKLKLQKEYHLYRPGDEVSVSDARGKMISGTYKGKSEGKILIDDWRIPVMDIASVELWRFDENLNTKKLAAATATVTDSFNKAKNDLKAELDAKLKSEFFRQNGYAELNKKWLTLDDYIKAKIDEEKKKAAAEAASTEKKIRAELEKSFDQKTFRIKSGYISVKNVWMPATKAIELLLKERKTVGLGDPAKAKKEALSEAEKELYPQHGYIFIDGKWQAAKDVLDTKVKIYLASRK